MAIEGCEQPKTLCFSMIVHNFLKNCLQALFACLPLFHVWTNVTVTDGASLEPRKLPSLVKITLEKGDILSALCLRRFGCVCSMQERHIVMQRQHAVFQHTF